MDEIKMAVKGLLLEWFGRVEEFAWASNVEYRAYSGGFKVCTVVVYGMGYLSFKDCDRSFLWDVNDAGLVESLLSMFGVGDFDWSLRCQMQIGRSEWGILRCGYFAEPSGYCAYHERGL